MVWRQGQTGVDRDKCQAVTATSQRRGSHLMPRSLNDPIVVEHVLRRCLVRLNLIQLLMRRCVIQLRVTEQTLLKTINNCFNQREWSSKTCYYFLYSTRRQL